MIIIDAQLSPRLARWISDEMGIASTDLRSLGLRDADDIVIFQYARAHDAVVMTKDADFVGLLERLGPPPKVIWITCGNTTNSHMCQILATMLPRAIDLLNAGDALVEIRG